MRSCFKQNKNDTSQDIIKSNFKIGKNTATEHIGRHCSSVANYKKGPKCILTAAISVKKMSWGCAVVKCMRPCIRTQHRGLNTSDYWGVKQTFLSVTPFGIICQMTFHINLQLYFAYLLSLPVKKPVSCCHIWAIWTSLSTPTCTEVSPFFDTVDRGLGRWHSGWVLAVAQQKLWVLLPAPTCWLSTVPGEPAPSSGLLRHQSHTLLNIHAGKR